MLVVKPSPGRVRDIRSLWLAVPAAVASGVVGVMIASQLLTIQPVWLAWSLHASVISGVWMLAGGHFAPRTVIGLSAIFAIGAALAWYLDRGIVFGISPYNGLTQFAVACAVGSLAWSWHAGDASLATRRAALLVPAATIVFGFIGSLGWPTHGIAVRLTTTDGRSLRVLTAADGLRSGRSLYVWTRDGALNDTASDSVAVQLELDPGSGDVAVTLHRIATAVDRERVCTVFRRHTERLVADEVEQGAVPWLIAQLPMRRKGCADGSFWVRHDLSRTDPAAAQTSDDRSVTRYSAV